MSENEEKCINCERNEYEAPLLQASFKGEGFAICSSCLPILIHEPHKLQSRLSGTEDLEPAPHNHD